MTLCSAHITERPGIELTKPEQAAEAVTEHQERTWGATGQGPASALTARVDSPLGRREYLVMTGVELETWMDAKAVSESERPQFRGFAKHSESCYTEDGKCLKNPIDREDLLSVLMGMERYLVDSNLPGLVAEARKPGNRNKAFILGQTFTDERENLKDALFGPNADNSNNNLFTFGYVSQHIQYLPASCLVIHRLDTHYRSIMDETRLKSESRPAAKRSRDDVEFIEREREHLDYVSDLKSRILNDVLQSRGVTDLPPVEFAERKKAQLLRSIRSRSADGFLNYWNAVEIASFCYASLLIEQDGVGEKTRNEFRDPNRRNVFGDYRLVQNALWLNACILSNDTAVMRMVGYLRLPGVKVIRTP